MTKIIPRAKFHYDSITRFAPPLPPNANVRTKWLDRLVFGFCLQPSLPAPIFTISASNDIVSRKKCAFGGGGCREQNFTFWHYFFKKNWNIGYFWRDLDNFGSNLLRNDFNMDDLGTYSRSWTLKRQKRQIDPTNPNIHRFSTTEVDNMALILRTRNGNNHVNRARHAITTNL